MRHLVAVVALFLVAFGATKIATAAVSELSIALVIGNSAYMDALLTNPVNDARLMAGTLRGPGFDVIERKGDQEFGEGNFRALFEFIEHDQKRRGVI